MSTFEKIQDLLVKKFGLDPSDIHADSTLESLGLDSLNVIELLFDLEDEFGITIPDDANNRVRPTSVGEVVTLLDNLLSREN
ncbi:MAG: acyl carrier protein [Burkholderiaceae bacterium]|nr:MAG: acyl carrier protein [Burkholderiaceae bacterium]